MMLAHFFPQGSGNLLADKRFAYAELLKAEGDCAAAADLLEQVTDLVPVWAPAFVALGLALEKTGQCEAAIVAMQRAETLDPEGMLGAPLHLARLRGNALSAMPAAYVATLFDQYAQRFNAHLIGTLGYRGPAVLVDALDRAGRGGNRFNQALDLGCGTGLMARAVADRVAVIDGVDLSARMIEQARATGLYRTLDVADCSTFLARTADHTYDLLLAADVFVYLGDLASILQYATRVLTHGGLLAFTVQSTERGDVLLGADLRFSHAPAYIRFALDRVGLVPRLIEAQSTRREGGSEVPGLVVVARAS